MTLTPQQQRPPAKRKSWPMFVYRAENIVIFKQNTIMKQYLYVVSTDDLGIVPNDEVVPKPLDALGRPH